MRRSALPIELSAHVVGFDPRVEPISKPPLPFENAVEFGPKSHGYRVLKLFLLHEAKLKTFAVPNSLSSVVPFLLTAART